MRSEADLPLLGLREAAAHLRNQVPLLFLQMLEQQRSVFLKAVLFHGREVVRSEATWDSMQES